MAVKEKEQAPEVEERYPELADDELREDTDTIFRELKSVGDNDPKKMLLVSGLLFGSALQSMLDAMEYELEPGGMGFGIPVCLPALSGGEWDGVSFQMHAVGLSKLEAGAHLHEEPEDPEEDES